MESNSPFAPPANNFQNSQSWQAGADGVQTPVRTTGLTVIFVLFVIFGGLGVLSGVAAGVAFAFEDVFNSMSGKDNVLVQRMQEAQAPFRIPGLVMAGINGLLGSMLLISAVGILTRRRWGLNLGRAACKIGIVFEVGRIIVGIAQNGYLMSVFMNVSPEDLGKNAPPEAAQFMAVTMAVSMVLGIIMALIYAIGKMVIYFLSDRHLAKPQVAGLFE